MRFEGNTAQTTRRLFLLLGLVCVIGMVNLSLFSRTSALVGEWTPPNLTRISTGDNHTCAVAGGKAYCWGDNTYGQLGTGNNVTSNIAVPVDASGALSGKTVTDIVAGGEHTCAIADGRAFCWGRNNFGQLGDYSTTDRSVPTALHETDSRGYIQGQTVTRITTGFDHSCLVAGGRAYCWGNDANRKLGLAEVYTPAQSRLPIAVNTASHMGTKTVTDISAGAQHTCAVADSQFFCWGLNTYGQLGDDTTVSRPAPTAVYTISLNGRTPTAVAAGATHTCGIASGVVHCWGRNEFNQLGARQTNSFYGIPATVDQGTGLSGKTVTNVTAGHLHSCVVASGVGYCWGRNADRQLGDWSRADRSQPKEIYTGDQLSGRTQTIVSAGRVHSCVIASGRAFCVGTTATGALGDGTTNVSRSSASHVKYDDGLGATPYRLFAVSSQSTTPGAPLAATNATAQLTEHNQQFRLRMGVKSANGLINIAPNALSLQLQYAPKTAANCRTQTTGFVTMTDSTPIGFYQVSGATNNSPINASSGNDPSDGPITYMTYRDAAGVFSNPQAIASGGNGLWDFSLRAHTAATNVSFCVRLINANAPLSTYASMAEVRTPPPSTVQVGFVSSAGTPISNPVFSLPTKHILHSCQTTSGALIDTSGARRLRISQSGPQASWNVSMAPTAGATAQWNRVGGGAGYDFNDASGNPAGCNSGSDGDGVAGQMSLRPDVMTIAPQSGCSAGLTLGAQSAYSASVSAITLVSGSTSAATNCYRDLYGGQVSQMIPANQPSGTYQFDMTVTAVMQ